MFEKYAVEYYAEYLDFLDKLGEMLTEKIELKYEPSEFRIAGQGLQVLAFWSKNQSAFT